MSQFNTMDHCLNRILELFPAQSVRIARRFAEDETFRGLCEDYCLARTTLFALKKRNDNSCEADIAEYDQLISELEAEMKIALFGKS